MNTPVVVVDDLPAGPATAVIASLAGPRGQRVALAIRSERSGQVVFFGPEDDLLAGQGLEALDAAVSFAEGMGFLFDDDRLARTPGEARHLWEALLEAAGRAALPHRVGRSAPAPEAQEPPGTQEELWLEDVATPAPAVSHLLPLTKFRSALGAPTRTRGASAAISRLPLARFRVGPERRSP